MLHQAGASATGSTAASSLGVYPKRTVPACHDRCRPSGLMRGAERSGLPNRARRGIRGRSGIVSRAVGFQAESTGVARALAL